MAGFTVYLRKNLACIIVIVCLISLPCYIRFYYCIDSSSSSCNNSLTIGLRDDQFTASSVYDDTHNASAAKWEGGEYIYIYK